MPINVPKEVSMTDISNTPSFVREGHPRADGVWIQYYGLNTRLRGRAYYSDIIKPDDQWEKYDGSTTEVVDLSEQTPENYHQTHNHYQAVLSEVLNFSPHTNAVPIWGDGAAVANGSAAWGAFFSARSAYLDSTILNQNVHLAKAVPDGFSVVPKEDYDCQLCGLEVDVLNSGKPGVYPNKAKHGLQVVGFGNPNSHALSVICERFDCPPEDRRGQFAAGLYFQNSIHPEYGAAIVGDFEQAHIGIDFRKPVFEWGAIQLNAPKPGSGIVFSEGQGGEIYSGKRWAGGDETPKWLTVRMGEEGLRIVSPDGTRELLAIDQFGGIYLNGDVYVNGRKLNTTTAERVGFWGRIVAVVKKMLPSLNHTNGPSPQANNG